ncbi:MAG: hypothetical protein C0399_02270 [Syntrophus sp. (in: bacteria)]|nr:hypothetical protein [Syntrophus sp. (in: bacteria)]
MDHKKLVFLVLILSVVCFVLQGCGSTRYVVGDGSKPLYLKNNIHTQQSGSNYKASYANWTDPGWGHVVIPVNAVVEIEYVRRYIFILEKDTGRRIEFEYDEGKMGMGIEQYVKLIMSTTPVSIKDFSEIDGKGIADGKVYVGMSKEGVRTAFGYPATHRTPSLYDSTWVFWRNRWGTTAIDFDNAGKVKAVR